MPELWATNRQLADLQTTKKTIGDSPITNTTMHSVDEQLVDLQKFREIQMISEG